VHHAHGHGLAVQNAVTRKRFHRMAQGVAEVQQGAGAGLALVFRHHRSFDAAVARQHRKQSLGIARQQALCIALQPGKERGIAMAACFTTSAQPARSWRGGKVCRVAASIHTKWGW